MSVGVSRGLLVGCPDASNNFVLSRFAFVAFVRNTLGEGIVIGSKS